MIKILPPLTHRVKNNPQYNSLKVGQNGKTNSKLNFVSAEIGLCFTNF